MAPFSDDDRILLYILKTKVKERGRGSWDVCQSIYNELATQTLSPDRLTAAYRNLDIAKLEAEADSAAWDAKREQVERCLLEASPVHHFSKREADNPHRKRALPGRSNARSGRPESEEYSALEYHTLTIEAAIEGRDAVHASPPSYRALPRDPNWKA
ncbi:hypothetical protein AA0113_g12254 [Alternaria arborescens]|uniref:Uncharacterized protein n=1 Tax=Alternaria arborescens TaxID=156630 RepID=A0A4Q4PXN7_9PLEO|nr:hypothetical protein AA0111_g11944 [Alternaria arborescens]RYO14589.1 hypothetical protein AA0111_g11944 [Alternaria arborescens]RYO27748.1 hypothetical protein AA0113_g12254 [Alternaria arborescens]